MRPTSFSQNIMFEKYPRQWYYQYIKKIPTISDYTYANAGTVVHKTLEQHYSKIYNNIDALKTQFKLLWKKYKLNESILKNKEDEYWLMVVNGINLNIELTSRELKIFFSDVVGYIDGVNTKDDILLDWKSSTRTKINEEEYKIQLMFYAYLYNRKFNRIPKKVAVHYLKYSGSKGELSFTPTEKDVQQAEDWHLTQRVNMERVIMHGKIPSKCKECNHWCPYTNLCDSDGKELKYDININGNYIHIDGPISEILNIQLTKKFSYELKNAYFMKKHNPHARTVIGFWDNRNRKLPIGFLNGLKKTLNDYAEFKKKTLELNIIDKREFDKDVIEMPEEFINGMKLRDYQQEAVNKFLEEKIAILEIGTGGGKTEIAIELIRRLKIKTLFIVDKIELMRQTKKRIEDSLGIEVGQLGSGVIDIKPITIATVQTLIKNITNSRLVIYLRSIKFCIFDETHKVAARSYWRLSQQLINTEYRLGISGTAYRDDGNDMMINAVVGYKSFDLSSKKLIEMDWLIKPQIKFIDSYINKEEIKELEKNAKTGLINETPNYSNYYNKFITQNKKRNAVILNIVNKNKDKKILILVKLIEHGELLESTISGSKYLHGSVSKNDRKTMFDDFFIGKINVLISTISIFAEGIDIPSLDMVINASGNKGDVKTVQVLGRVLRKMEGKKNAQYIDFMDGSRFFRGASLARKKILEREGHDIEVIEYEETK